MKIARWLVAGLVLSAGLAQAQSNLQASMAKLDAASTQFHSFQASFHKELRGGPPINDITLQDGTTYFLRVNGKPQMGIRIVGPGARTVQYKNGVLKDYNPGIKCYDTVTPGSQSTVDTYLALGFGGSGKDLENSWNVTDLGPDTVNGTKVEKLDLFPKDAGAKANVKHITLWMVLERGYALKQILYAPSGDTTTAVYSNIKFNDKKVDTDPYDFPSGARPCGK